MQNEAKNENLEWNVENQLELLLVKMRDQKEDLGNCPICNERVIKFGGIFHQRIIMYFLGIRLLLRTGHL
jgi:hypothetical protein